MNGLPVSVVKGVGCARLTLVVLALLLVTLSRVSAASSPQTIEWYMIDLPPIQNQTGVERGQGYTDWIRWRLVAGLDGYRHVLRLSNVHRMLHDLEIKPNICNTAFLRTEARERFMVYADPLHAQFPNGIAVQRMRLESDYAAYLDGNGAFEINALAQAGAGVIAVQSGRSYGAEIDAAIAHARKDDRVFTITTNHRPMDAKFGLLRAGRVDVLPLYPYEFSYHLRGSTFADTIAFLPVEGNAVYTLNHLACSRSALGDEVIAASNPLIAEERDGYFAAAYRHWLPDSMRPLHARHHHHAFGSDLVDQEFHPFPGDEFIAECMLTGGAWYNGACER